MLLILYGSLYPFSGWVSGRDPFAFLAGGAPLRISLGDVVTNVLAYMPLGFLLRRSLYRRSPLVVSVALATVTGFLLSASVEAVQAYLPLRVSSLVDLITNTVGTWIGASLEISLRRDDGLSRALRGIRRQWIVRGGVADIGLFGVATWALAQLLPLVPSLDVGKFRHALAPLAQLVAAPKTLDGWRVVADSLSYFGMALVATSLVRPDRPRLAAFACLALALLFAQIPLVSGELQGEALLGCFTGLLAAVLFRSVPGRFSANLALFSLFAAFCVNEALGTGQGRVVPFQWIPFAAMLENPLIGIRNILEGLSLGALLAWSLRTAHEHAAGGPVAWLGGVLVIGGALALEYGQRHIAGRIGDITLPLTVGIAWVVAWRAPDHPVEPETVEPAPPHRAEGRLPLLAWNKSPLWRTALQILILTLVISWVTRQPGVPYNVRELIYQGHPLRSALLLAIELHWLFAVPVWLVAWPRPRLRPASLTLAVPLLALHGLVAWWLVSNAVPSRNVHDIVGAPILAWPGETETMVRFIGLHSAIAMHVLGAALLASCLTSFRNIPTTLAWGLLHAVLAPLWYWIIVTQAATDNLTELMRDGGSWQAGVFLSLAVLLSFASGSLIATAVLGRRRVIAAVLATGCVLAAYQLYGAGTEEALAKYGQIFSAMQFLLSQDRAHYATGWALLARFALAQAALSLVVAWFQATPLRQLAHADRALPTGAR